MCGGGGGSVASPTLALTSSSQPAGTVPRRPRLAGRRLNSRPGRLSVTLALVLPVPTVSLTYTC